MRTSSGGLRSLLRRLAGTLLLVAASSPCACHDDYPDRLKKGCSSGEECGRLVSEAVDRLNDCARYLVGNRERYETVGLDK